MAATSATVRVRPSPVLEIDTKAWRQQFHFTGSDTALKADVRRYVEHMVYAQMETLGVLVPLQDDA